MQSRARQAAVCVALGSAGLLISGCGDVEHVDPAPRPDTEAPPLHGPVGAADVSILFPLPARATDFPLLKADSSGARGTVLPWRFVEQLPRLQPMLSNEVAYPVTRVVSARIDPCFPGFDLE